MRKIISVVVLLLLIVSIVGCGETVSGIGKDATRIGQGVRKVFVRDGS